MAYIVIALAFGLAGGIVGKVKGSSFFIWFMICALVPVIGLVAALFYRFETDEPRQQCPGCRRLLAHLRRDLPPLRHRAGLPRRADRLRGGGAPRAPGRLTADDGPRGRAGSAPSRAERRNPAARLADSGRAAAPARGISRIPGRRRAHASGRRLDGVPEGGGCRRRIRTARRRQPPDLRRVLRRRHQHILVRHEAGGGHAAEGYAKATGKVGVSLGTSGPGATNLITPICDAMMDSVPVVFITGQVRTDLLGTDGFQEADTIGITMPIVKHSRHDPAPAGAAAGDPRGLPPRPHRAPGPGASSTSRMDLSRADIPYEPVDRRAPARLPADDRRQPEADPPGRQGAGQRPAPGDLRGRRRGQRQRVRRSSSRWPAATASRSPAR